MTPLQRGALCLLLIPLAFGSSCSRLHDERRVLAQDPAISTISGMLPSVVRIEAIRLVPDQGRMIKIKTGGSGAIISAEGHVITNYHVARDADLYVCHLADGSELEATLTGMDALSDIAVLKLGAPKGVSEKQGQLRAPLPVARFGDSDAVHPGQTVYALGSPASLSSAVTRGIIANPTLVMPQTQMMILDGENVGSVIRWLLHDASIFPGNSGGPLVNEHGEIIGINELGVANLGGAIPGNLARRIADELIAKGRVTRGWSGVSIQGRLESDGAKAPGVLISSVAPDSPAAKAGLKPGDVVLALEGQALESGVKAPISFNRLEMSHQPGQKVAFSILRAGNGKPETATVELAQREAAIGDEEELRAWGAVFRELTREMAAHMQLPDKNGVLVDNIRPGGPAGQGEPELRPGDVLVSVEGTAVATREQLRTLTTKLMTAATGPSRTVLVEFKREGALLCSVVELRNTNPRNIPPSARKAWLGAMSQPLTPKLAARLAIKSEGGARITRIHPGTKAEASGLRVGDVVLAVDDIPVTARRAEDADMLARQLRQYKPGATASFRIWREGVVSELPVVLELQPIPAAETPWWEDVQLEFAVHEIAFEDRTRLQLPTELTKGLIVESAQAAGWAALAGMRASDLILEADDTPVSTIASLRQAREAALASQRRHWKLKLLRQGQTLFIEINLKPLSSTSSS